MKRTALTAAAIGLMFALMIGRSARADVVFTNDTVISPFDTNYDGASLVVSNCTLTVDGPHAFSNLLVAAGGTLTHTLSTSGVLTVSRSFSDEPQLLTNTDAVSLSNTGALTSAIVTDSGHTVTYTNDQDYVFWFPGAGVIQLQRTTNSAIPDGATVLVSYTVQISVLAKLNLNVAGTVEIAAGGAVGVNGKGYGGNLGPGNGGESPSSPISGGGASYGGTGGMSSSNGPGGVVYGSFVQPTDPGSGGGYGASGSTAVGGAGGGVVRIIAGGNLIINGLISANGADATNNRSGGGAGGSIWLTAQTIAGSGAMTANGGVGEPIHGGGGGGGRIALEAGTNGFTGSITAYGGTGARNGGAGTVYTKLTALNGSLLIDNGGQSGTNFTTLQVSNGADVTLRGRAAGVPFGVQSMGTLFVSSNSVITAPGTAFFTITTAGDTTIEAGGRLTTDGQGSFTSGNGLSVFVSSGIYYCGGGGHGGVGGSGASPNARGGVGTDSTASPTFSGGAGAGSGSSFSPFGGLGGGVIRMTVNGKLTLNGKISSDGRAGTGGYAGGGAGGSVWLTLQNWTGSGSISANGGPGILPGGGGGGGGRISISFSTNAFSGAVTAYGGIGTNSGGAGTIYLRTNFQTIAQIILDNGDIVGTNTVADVSVNTDLIVRGRANFLFSSSTWSVHNLQVSSNCIVASPFPASTSPSAVNVTATGDATIDAGGIFMLDGRGYTVGSGPGSGNSNTRGGGGHGGFGGANSIVGGNAYGSIISPNTAGSAGGGSSPPLGGAGGGILNFTVTGALTVNGRLSSNGRDGDPGGGGGAGGTLNINCGSLRGSGIVSVNGGQAIGVGGGGGGRMLIAFTSNTFSGTLTAFGGTGLVGGGAGTIYLKFKNASVGDVLVSNGGLTGTNTPFSSSLGLPTAPFNLTIRDGAAVVPLTTLPAISNLTVAANGSLILLSNQTSLTVGVTRDVHVDAGGAITVDGKGYGRGNGPGPGTSVFNKGSGGGYGAVGGISASGAVGGTNYGSATQPVDRGSGGGAGSSSFFGGSDGGGAIRLSVGGTLFVNGALSANGNPGLQDDSGGGAGGSIWVVATAVSGNGFISANGGPGDLFGGGGGAGGRIAIYSLSNSFAGSITASGGAGFVAGGAGSLLLATNLPTVQGTITDTNGQPAAGVLLRASIGDASTTTGPDGRYVLALVPVANFTVTPSSDGFMFVPGSRFFIAPIVSVTNADFIIVSTTAATVTCSLQDTNVALDLFGIPGVTYWVHYSTNLVDWQIYGSPLVGTNGPLQFLVPMDGDPKKFFRVRASN